MRAVLTGVMLVCAYRLAAVAEAAPLLEFFPPTVYDADTSAMDQALGFVGGIVEDFEDDMLIPGLSVTLVGTLGGYDLYPYHGNPRRYQYPNGEWDGPYSGQNLEEGWPASSQEGHRSRTIFTLPEKTIAFGIGLSHVNLAQVLLVNGVVLQNPTSVLSGWSTTGDRNGYLKITAEPGETIQTVEFRQKVVAGSIEEIIFDHLIVQPLPEPAGLPVAAVGILALRRRRPRCIAAMILEPSPPRFHRYVESGLIVLAVGNRLPVEAAKRRLPPALPVFDR